MIYLAAMAAERKESLPEGLNFLHELTSFVQKLNIRVMNEPAMEFADKLNMLSKCIDILMFKPVRALVQPPEKVLQLRVLCFNNLSCIYKLNKQFEDALKAVEVALEIEEALLEKNYEDTFKTISSTYINKCVILSELSLHDEAIKTIKASLANIERYRDMHGKDLTEKESVELSYMTMFAYFNIAVEHEHLELTDLAIKFYEVAFREAKKLGNWSIKNRIITALKKLKNGR